VPRLAFNPFTGNFDYVTRRGENTRVGVALSGAVDGTNVTFATPQKFLVRGGCTIAVYLNGVRLSPGATSDYVIAESGGPGSGHDTVILAIAPKPTPTLDQLVADYMEL
jgi:hypothetical protein